MIRIPRTLASKLRANAELDGAVRLSLAHFDDWLADRNLYFFPEYTDHGPQHVTEVIGTAVELMSRRAPFTGADAAVLLLGCLLHDCAMHLTADGFGSLVRPGSGYDPIGGFPDKPWDELWQDFLSEARRFDDNKLLRLFGDTDPVREPPLDGHLDDRDRYLVGEFLRRHHPRLAHEIAHYGVPGPGPERIRLVGVEPKLADLAGLVARSHGMSLRACLPYLADRYHKREFAGVHAAWLMTLLRVADYLQIRAERAPHRLLEVRRLRSPISRLEWRVHHSISNITTAEDDPEAILIQAQPEDLGTYLRLRQWLDGIQEELDSSWAVLGELYGRDPRLAGLGLGLRRVLSNLDDEVRFARQVPYIPVPAAFTATGPRLLHLLVGPLYEDNPAFGVRELLQNALDAVRELEYLRQKLPQLQHVTRIEQEADVVVRLEDDWLTVSDRGIGMTAEVLREYFLKAGASFRSSDAWKRRFEDDQGRAQVLRSGRFGIGALAAFLLGDRIEVTTRHAEAAATDGIAFAASLDDDPIEMRRAECAVGTTVRVKLRPGVADNLARVPRPWEKGAGLWDWYTLATPSVARLHRGNRLPQRYSLPAEDGPLPPGRHRIRAPEYRDIQWTYDTEPGLICNGIIVRRQPYSALDSTPLSDFEGYWDAGLRAKIPLPNLSVFDPSGRLPLNLPRTELGGNFLPFHGALHEACILRFLAATLAAAPTHGFVEGAPFTAPHPYPVRNWYSTERGICVCDANLMHQSGLKAFLILPGEGQVDLGDTRLAPGRIPSYFYNAPRNVASVLPALGLGGGVRILVRTNSPETVLTDIQDWEIEEERREWTLYRKGPCPPAHTDFQNAVERLLRADNFKWIGVLAEFYPAETEPPATPVSRIWNEVIRAPFMPFSMADRRAQLPHAFEALKEYLADFAENRPPMPPDSSPSPPARPPDSDSARKRWQWRSL